MSRAASHHRPLKILLVSSEAVPYAKTGGLADVAGALPSALVKLGCEVALVMPKYRAVTQERFKLQLEERLIPVPMGMGDLSADILSGRLGNTHGKVYFIQNNRYFDREGLYGSPEGDYQDNAERFAFFGRAVLEMCRAIKWIPDVIHLNDWQTGLIAPYLKVLYGQDKHWAKVRTLFTIHNMAYQGVFPKYILPMTGLGWEEFTHEKMEFYDQINFLKAGLVYSDALSTVSESYAKEIQTDEFGHGLQGVLGNRKIDLFGILNGVDYDEWNPATDKEIPAQYTAKNHERKDESKRKLLAEIGLPYHAQTPVVGLVSRLVDQKGLDLIAEIMDPFLEQDAQLVVLGTGDPRYHQFFEDLERRYPDRVAAELKFDNRLAKLIYAGSDLFLMPSRFEPCGLGQMIAMKYGTVPVVRRTGGLADTVQDLTLDGLSGNGFVFDEYKGDQLFFALRRGLEAFRQPKLWKELVNRAMRADFSWDASAVKYLELYRKLAAPKD